MLCFESLKVAYQLILDFENTEKLLKEYFKLSGMQVDGNQRQIEAMVELIAPSGCYNLKDVKIREQETQTEENPYSGFLKNLGSEISAVFVNKNIPKQHKAQMQFNSVSITKIDTSDKNCEEGSLEHDNNELSNETTNTDCDVRDPVLRCKRKNDLTAADLVCKKCGKKFSKKEYLTKHWNHMHTRYPGHLCSLCGFLSRTQSGLMQHINSKHLGKKFKCHICGRALNSSGALNSHLRVHSNRRLFLCSECGKTFNYGNALKTHIRLVHRNERNFRCGYCDKRFLRASSLKAHLPKHTGEKAFRCEHCGKAYVRICNLRLHLKHIHNLYLEKRNKRLLEH